LRERHAGVAALVVLLLAAAAFASAGAARTHARFQARAAPAGCAAAGCPAPVGCNRRAGRCWHPPARARWDYQLQGTPNGRHGCRFRRTGFIDVGVRGRAYAGGRRVAPRVFDIDFYEDGKCYRPQNYGVLNFAAVRALHRRGDRVIAYVDAGTAERWRPDFAQYRAFDRSCRGCLFGKPLSQYRDEYYLNINADATGVNPRTHRRQNQRQFILSELAARLQKVARLRFDAVEFDNVDAWENPTGVRISAATQLVFNSELGNLAHRMGFTVALKNDPEQLPALGPYFDLAVSEQCLQYRQCGVYRGWVAHRRLVLDVEYSRAPRTFCPRANRLGLNAIRTTDDLYGIPYVPCR
jgi:Glycoside-hydrolase family GH114